MNEWRLCSSVEIPSLWLQLYAWVYIAYLLYPYTSNF